MPLQPLTLREWMLLSLFATLAAVALLAPAVPPAVFAGSPFGYQLPAHGLPSVLDVLSSLPMALIGIWGLRWLRWHERILEDAEDAAPVPQAFTPHCANPLDCAWMFFAGLILTAAAAAFYHLQPGAMRLAADRAGVAVVFAGFVGFMVCERISLRAGWPAAWFTLAGGLLAVAVGHRTGNALPWALLQIGGLVLMLALTFMRPARGAIGIRLGWVVFVFMLARLFEFLDRTIYDASHQWLSGFGLKHLTAAAAALIVLYGLQALRPDRAAQSVRRRDGVSPRAASCASE